MSVSVDQAVGHDQKTTDLFAAIAAIGLQNSNGGDQLKNRHCHLHAIGQLGPRSLQAGASLTSPLRRHDIAFASLSWTASGLVRSGRFSP